jgi:hypothetical protein
MSRAILAEGRHANRLMQQIEDGSAAWDAAGSNLVRRARSSLPLAAQMKLLWARLHAGGEFVYGPYRAYAALSAVIRTLPFVVIAVLAPFGGDRKPFTPPQPMCGGWTQSRQKDAGSLVTILARIPLRSRFWNCG